MQTVFCNTKLPRNAINTEDLKPGMRFTRAYDTEATVHVVEEVRSHSIKTVTGTVHLGRHGHVGTVRLVDPPEGYDYHAGHGCTEEASL